MDEKTTKQMIEDEIRSCVEGLKYVEQGGEQHAQLVADIQRLTQAYLELEKFDYQKADTDRKFAEDLRKSVCEMQYKDDLEREKMKEEKKAGIRDACIKLGLGLGTIGMYALFIGLGMRLEFIDHGSITSFTVKELLRKLSPKV